MAGHSRAYSAVYGVLPNRARGGATDRLDCIEDIMEDLGPRFTRRQELEALDKKLQMLQLGFWMVPRCLQLGIGKSFICFFRSVGLAVYLCIGLKVAEWLALPVDNTGTRATCAPAGEAPSGGGKAHNAAPNAAH